MIDERRREVKSDILSTMFLMGKALVVGARASDDDYRTGVTKKLRLL